jgi:hypothetical protein
LAQTGDGESADEQQLAIDENIEITHDTLPETSQTLAARAPLRVHHYLGWKIIIPLNNVARVTLAQRRVVPAGPGHTLPFHVMGMFSLYPAICV